MKTSEFIRRLGSRYRVVSFNYGHLIKIVDSFCDEVAVISCLKSSDISLSTKDIGLAKLCIEYAETPIEEREEEKKYTVILPDSEPDYPTSLRYVLYRTDSDKIAIVHAIKSKLDIGDMFHLTESEIKKNHEYLWQFAKEVKE